MDALKVVQHEHDGATDDIESMEAVSEVTMFGTLFEQG